jgi:hypothetical protein
MNLKDTYHLKNKGGLNIELKINIVGDLDWNNLAQDRNNLWANMYEVMNCHVP